MGRFGPRRPAWLRMVVAVVGICVLLSVAAGLSISTSQALAKTAEELQQELGNTRDLLREAREGKEEAQQRLAAAEQEIQTLDLQIESLEGQLSEVATKAEAAQAQVDATRAELNRLTADLDASRRRLLKAEEDLATQEQLLNRRLVSAYKAGTLGFVEVLLESAEFTDLLNRLDLVAIILRRDQAVIRQIVDLKDEVGRQQVALESQRAEVLDVARRQETEAAELAALVADRQRTLEGLDSARRDKQSVAARAENDRRGFEQQEQELAARSQEIQGLLQSAGVSSVPAMGTGALAMPMPGELSSRYGMRTLFGVTRMHNGIDISAPMGTPIKAADSGTVVLADWNGGYGKCVIINHGGGMATLYGHLSEIQVAYGQQVSQGQVIGLCGSTGFSTGPHLHFEVRINGSPADPLSYL